MISKIIIQNYKSLKHIDIECSNLNILTGVNGMGKSSILQSLLLLRQSNNKDYLKKDGLTLKGDLVNVGTGKDALCQDANKEEISFSLSFNKDSLITHLWIFGYNSDSDVLPYAEDTTIPENLGDLPLFNSQFQYLCADRWVENQYDRSDYQVGQKRNLGKHGEYTSHYLEYYGEKKGEEVSEPLLYPKTTNNELRFQVSAWMSEISPGTVVTAAKIIGIEGMKLSYEFESSNGKTNDFTPTNVGFGITYVLPIIVALLNAKPGDILIIENPESHLHPKGQSAIARLMSLVAEQGVQIFVESHSDHIINGILVSINQDHKKISNGIKSKNVKIFFLERDADTHIAKASNINIQENGRIKHAPTGFFDQFSNDMKTMMGF